VTQVKMEARQPCHICGAPCRWIQIASVRVNKRSLRQRNAIGAQIDRWCLECRARQPGEMPNRWWLDAESTALVEAVRARTAR